MASRRSGRSAIMQSSRSIEPPNSAAPGIVPGPVDVCDDGAAAHGAAAAEPTSERADPPGNSDRARGPFAKLLSVVRGDKYVADAYEPAWSALMERRAASVVRRDDGGELAVDVGSAVEPKPVSAGRAVPAASTPMER
jgi:hypothetical protein